jgi:hypothetical protein
MDSVAVNPPICRPLLLKFLFSHDRFGRLAFTRLSPASVALRATILRSSLCFFETAFTITDAKTQPSTKPL